MKPNSFVLAAATLAALTLSSTSFAGGRGGGGPVFRVGGFHGGHGATGWGGSRGNTGFRWARGMPAASGWRFGAGVYSTRYGHTNTAFVGHTNPAWYGHTDTAWPNGFAQRGYGRLTLVHRFPAVGRFRRFASYGFTPRERFRRVVPGFIGPGGYYADELGLGPYELAAPGYGYAEPPLAAGYGEAPLGPYGDGAYGGYAGYARSYGGGPRIIVVHPRSRLRVSEACACGRRSGAGPVVYRFGVGSYY